MSIVQNRASGKFLTSANGAPREAARNAPATQTVGPAQKWKINLGAQNQTIQNGDGTTLRMENSGALKLDTTTSSPPTLGQWAVESSSLPPLNRVAEASDPPDVCGFYRTDENTPAQGRISQQPDGTLQWASQSGQTWSLHPHNRSLDISKVKIMVLDKDPGSPAQNLPNGQSFIIERDSTKAVTGFNFLGKFYKRH
jgi:hypothetical protein